MTGRSVGRRSDRNGTCSFRVLPPSSSSPASSFFHCGSSAQLSSAQHSGDRQRDGSILRVGIVVSGTANYFVRAILGRRGDGETVFCHAYCLYALPLSPSCLSFSFSSIYCGAPKGYFASFFLTSGVAQLARSRSSREGDKIGKV